MSRNCYRAGGTNSAKEDGGEGLNYLCKLHVTSVDAVRGRLQILEGA